jgi:hypothetical protein
MTPPEILFNLFRVGDLGQINPFSSSIPLLDNEISRKFDRIMQEIVFSRNRNMNIQIVRFGIDTILEAEIIQSIFIEDSTPSGPSYADFLCKIHGQIQQELSHSSTSILPEKTALLSFFH